MARLLNVINSISILYIDGYIVEIQQNIYEYKYCAKDLEVNSFVIFCLFGTEVRVVQVIKLDIICSLRLFHI